MSKLSEFFGMRKKKKREISPTEQNDQVTIYRIEEPLQYPRRVSETLPQNVDDNENHSLENLQFYRSQPSPKPLLSSKNKLCENDDAEVPKITGILRKRTACPNRRSVIDSVNQTGRRISAERLSILLPMSQTDQIPEQRRISRVLNAPEVNPKRLTWSEEVPGTRFSILNSKGAEPKRLSAIQNVAGPTKQIRLSAVKPTDEINENTKVGRLSIVKPLDEAERFALNPDNEPVIYAVRRSVITPKKKAFFKNKSVKMQYVEGRERERRPRESVIYSATPTRGRTSSVLQQSVKTLTSRDEEVHVPRKNIRYSMDTDVFSVDARHRSDKSVSPGYVTMERGQGVLVSELLNPITSIFVSDLKDPIPKDPLRKPREFNNWVRPRQNSMRQVVHQNAYPVRTQSNRVSLQRVSTPPPPVGPKPVQKYSRNANMYDDDDDDYESSSYSEESLESFDTRPKYNRMPTNQRVYAAEMPSMILPSVAHEIEVDKELAMDTVPNIPEPSKDYPRGSTEEQRGSIEEQRGSTEEQRGSTEEQRGSTEEQRGSTEEQRESTKEQKEIELLQPAYVGRLSSAQKTEVMDTLDFLCSPPAGISKDAVLAFGTGSKVRWQMEIKKEDKPEGDNENKL